MARQDLTTWLQLPLITEAEGKRLDQIQGKLTGDAAYEYKVSAERNISFFF